MNLKTILTVLLFLPLVAMAQEVNTEVSADIKATGDNVLRPVGELKGRLYYLKPGFARNAGDYSLMTFDANDLAATPEETAFDKIAPAIKSHDIAYAFIHLDRVYLVTIFKDQYFGTVINTDKTAEKSNVPLYKAGMTKSTIAFAEVSQTADKKQLVLMYMKVPKGKTREYGFMTFGQDWTKLEDHVVKIADPMDEVLNYGMFYSSSGRFYVSATGYPESYLYVYDSKTKEKTKFQLEEQGKKQMYENASFHEAPDGAVWIPYTFATDAVTHYSLFRQRASEEMPELVEHHEFSEKTLTDSKQFIYLSARGLYVGTTAKQMVFSKTGDIYLIFECVHGDRIEYMDDSPKVYYQDIICVTLNKEGIAMKEALIFKTQFMAMGLVKRWTLGRRVHSADFQKADLGLSMSFSFVAFENNGKLQLIFNDARASADKNESRPSMYKRVEIATLILVTIEGSSVTKEVLIPNDNYSQVCLPRFAIPLANGAFMTSTTSSKNQTAAFLIKP